MSQVQAALTAAIADGGAALLHAMTTSANPPARFARTIKRLSSEESALLAALAPSPVSANVAMCLAHDDDLQLSERERNCAESLEYMVVGRWESEEQAKEYQYCRNVLLSLFYRQRNPVYKYEAQDCGFWGELATPD